jgi:hypothetical protein
MDGIDLTCERCGATWKLIKAGDGPVTCPKCHAVVGSTLAAGTPAGEATPAAPAGNAARPAATAASPPSPRPAADDADDPGIGVPSLGRMPDLTPTRRGRHPLVTVAIILLLLFLVPVALCSVLFAVCTFAFG